MSAGYVFLPPPRSGGTPVPGGIPRSASPAGCRASGILPESPVREAEGGGAEGRVLAPGRQLPAQVVLSSTEHKANNSTPADGSRGLRGGQARSSSTSWVPGQKHQPAPWDAARANSPAWRSGSTVPALQQGAAGRCTEARVSTAMDFEQDSSTGVHGSVHAPTDEPALPAGAARPGTHSSPCPLAPPGTPLRPSCPLAAISLSQRRAAQGQPGAGRSHPETHKLVTSITALQPNPASPHTWHLRGDFLVPTQVKQHCAQPKASLVSKTPVLHPPEDRAGSA